MPDLICYSEALADAAARPPSPDRAAAAGHSGGADLWGDRLAALRLRAQTRLACAARSAKVFEALGAIIIAELDSARAAAGEAPALAAVIDDIEIAANALAAANHRLMAIAQAGAAPLHGPHADALHKENHDANL